ncbi:MAG: hypothetical protein A2075_02210 [Geobacteraceae bacterium GWC2_58_44]|nr:MAG: hypothetical protein A2075_02210 [Geobacteraceae bacterium GWC2_58_44]
MPSVGEPFQLLSIQEPFDQFPFLTSDDLPLFRFLPLQGGGQEGEGGVFVRRYYPTPTLPLKGREFFQRTRH